MKQFNLKSDDIGKRIVEIKDNFRFPSIVEEIAYVIESHDILEKEIQTTDFRWYQMNIIPYKVGKTNQTNGVIMTFVEITAQIKDLKNHETLVSEYETLLATIAHDIKTPMTSLLLTVEHLKNIPDHQSKAYLTLFTVLENSITKMQGIISELTDTEKLKDKFEEEEELLDFENILEDVRLTLTGIILRSGAAIHSEINVSEVFYSRRKLRSVIYNLINNAIKFQPLGQKPEIFIKTERKDDYIIITVKDNGIGIDPTSQEGIFLKYQRVNKSIEGTSIGLYLVSQIVTASGGKILLESELGKGAQFQIYLPDVKQNRNNKID